MKIKLVTGALAAATARAALPGVQQEFLADFFSLKYNHATAAIRSAEDKAWGYHDYQTLHFEDGTPELIRMAFHECSGKCNGCLNFGTDKSSAFNNGLKPSYDRIQEFYKLFTAYMKAFMRSSSFVAGGSHWDQCGALQANIEDILGEKWKDSFINSGSEFDGLKRKGTMKNWGALDAQLCSIWKFWNYTPITETEDDIISFTDFLHTFYHRALVDGNHNRHAPNCQLASYVGAWWTGGEGILTNRCFPHANFPRRSYGRSETNMDNCGYSDEDLPSDAFNFEDNLAAMQKIYPGITAAEFTILYTQSHGIGGVHKDRSGYESGSWTHYPSNFGRSFAGDLLKFDFVPECNDNGKVTWFPSHSWRYVGREIGFRQHFHRPSAKAMGVLDFKNKPGYIQPPMTMVPSDMSMRYNLPSNMTCALADAIRENYFTGDKSLMPSEAAVQIAAIDSVKGGDTSGFFNAVTAFFDEFAKMTRNGYIGGYTDQGTETIQEQTVEVDAAVTDMCAQFWGSRDNYLHWYNDESRDAIWKESKGLDDEGFKTFRTEKQDETDLRMVNICYNVGTRAKYFRPTVADWEALIVSDGRVQCDECVNHYVPPTFAD